MRKNIAVAAACITFAVLIGNSVNVSAESIPVTKKQVQLLSGVVKNVAKIKPVQKKGPDVEVGLLSGQSQVEIEGLSHFRIETNGKVWKSYNAGKRISVSRKGKNIVLEGKAFNAPVYFTTGNGEEAFSVKGNRYRGEMKIIPSAWNNGVTVVNRVPMELYLKGVVPSEIVPSWKPDDTRSQVYRGCSVETSATNKAVEETAGEIITYNGKAIDALFHANGGGYTEDSENVWGSYVPYLRGVKEENSSTVNRPWRKIVSIDSFSNAISRAGYPVGKVKKIGLSRLHMGNNKAKDRGVSGRVKTMEITGKSGRKIIPGEVIQSAFDLDSTLFDISAKGNNLIITGYGFGHGLGLSQWGAEAMAEKNGDGKEYYKRILLHYFTGSKIEKIY